VAVRSDAQTEASNGWIKEEKVPLRGFRLCAVVAWTDGRTERHGAEHQLGSDAVLQPETSDCDILFGLFESWWLFGHFRCEATALLRFVQREDTVRNCGRKSPPLDPTLSQLNPERSLLPSDFQNNPCGPMFVKVPSLP